MLAACIKARSILQTSWFTTVGFFSLLGDANRGSLPAYRISELVCLLGRTVSVAGYP